MFRDVVQLKQHNLCHVWVHAIWLCMLCVPFPDRRHVCYQQDLVFTLLSQLLYTWQHRRWQTLAGVS
jgi:hypothetical protein